MNLKYLLFLLALVMGTGCKNNSGQEEKKVSLSDQELYAKADSLARAFIIVDTHVDLPYRLLEEKFVADGEHLRSVMSTTEGDFDYERAKKGGLNAPFMSVYIPSSYQQKPDYGKSLADSIISMVTEITMAEPARFALANTPSDVIANFEESKISLPMGMENGAPIGNDLRNVRYFFDRGIRYITLTHAKDNQICDSSYDSLNTWNGLSPFGEQVVKEMNRVGIMVDISHVSDSTFYDVLKITTAPLIASHSSCRYFTPGFQRNMSDDMIKALARNDGVIQINFGATFVDSTARNNEKLLDSLLAILKGKKLTSRDSAAQPIIDQFAKDHTELFSDVERVADHIDHVVKIAGIDHVGLGSDFDGVWDSLPLGLKDVSYYPNLIFALLKRGYSSEDIEKICSKNLLRVWDDVIHVANESQ